MERQEDQVDLSQEESDLEDYLGTSLEEIPVDTAKELDESGLFASRALEDSNRLNSSIESLAQAQDELHSLNQELQLKKKKLNEFEDSLQRKEMFLQEGEAELEEKKQILVERETALQKRLIREEEALLQDQNLLEKRLRARVDAEMEAFKEDFTEQKTALESRIKNLQKRLKASKGACSRWEKKFLIAIEKQNNFKRQIGVLEAQNERLTVQKEKFESELENMKNKSKIETWRMERSVGKKEVERVEDEKQKMADFASSSAKQMEQMKRGRDSMMLLCQSLTRLILDMDTNKLVIPPEVFIHGLLPGLCSALELTLSESDDARRVQETIELVLVCVQGTFGGERDPCGGDPALLHRFASKYLQILTKETASRKSPISRNPELRLKAILCIIALAQLKKPLDNVTLVDALRMLSKGASVEKCQVTVLVYPIVIESLLLVVSNADNAAWRLCVRESITILFGFTQKGPLQAKFLYKISRAMNFPGSCIAVLNAMKALGDHQADDAFLECTCEAGSFVAFVLQRLTATDAGADFCIAAFRSADLLGMMEECVRIASSPKLSPRNQDSLDFFALNGRSVIASLRESSARQEGKKN